MFSLDSVKRFAGMDSGGVRAWLSTVIQHQFIEGYKLSIMYFTPHFLQPLLN